ncbi:MAG: L,D-transpeptidase family protein [Bacteroidales bacterium]|nr:L,D-transpeptidase family protein [Bacteroidales bacterium]
MKRIIKIGIGCIFILGTFSCQTMIKNAEVNVQHIAHNRFDYDLYRLFIKFRFNPGSNPDTILASIHNLDSLANFYAQRNYEPIWTRNMLNHSIIDTIKAYFNNASTHGLQPKFYNTSLIDNCLKSYVNSIKNDTSINYLALANLELLLSDAIITYRNHLVYGAIDPTETDPEAYHLPLDRPDSATFFDPLKTRDIVEYLESIQPKDAAYVSLQKALAKYKGIQVQGGWRSIDVLFSKDQKLELGDTAYFLDKLAERLKITGELSNNYTVQSIELDSTTYSAFLQRDFPDSINYQFEVSYYIYDNDLVKAVQEFQKLNGLFVDGVVGNQTINRMDIPVQERIAQINANLERLRWFDYPENTKYILVNIPDFKLYIFEKGNKELEMKVCVGKKRDWNYAEKLEIFKKTRNRNCFPNNNETPLLHGYIEYFVLNPKWNVPDNIGKNEIYSKVLNDPEYLSKRNFKVFFNGSEVSADSIDWSNYNADRLPFKFQQDASDGNALGKVKFIFENNYNIYLHDTPSKQAFSYTNRAVSHGCIRLEKPIEMAKLLTNDIEGMTGEEIDETLSGSKIIDRDVKTNTSKTVFLKNELPLYINYFTSWVDEDGNLHFRDDVYEKDKNIIKRII